MEWIWFSIESYYNIRICFLFKFWQLESRVKMQYRVGRKRRKLTLELNKILKNYKSYESQISIRKFDADTKILTF